MLNHINHKEFLDKVITGSAAQAVDHLEREMDGRNLLPMTDEMRDLIKVHTAAAMYGMVAVLKRSRELGFDVESLVNDGKIPGLPSL